VKKPIAIFLLGSTLFAHTELHQLLRLSVFIHHYLEHVTLDNNLSVFEFVRAHYSDNINHPDDQHRDHENLPFKSNDHNTQTITIFLPIVSQNTQQIYIGVDKIKSITDQQSICCAYLQNIWQPPRFS